VGGKRLMQVTIIGGGSYQWTPKLVIDLLRVPALAGLDLVLEDIDPVAVERLGAYARMASERIGAKATVTTTTDQRTALSGADFVVVTISTGGFEAMTVDLDVPARHGIRQSVGDSVGPGGVNRSLRNVPVLVGIGQDMEECCPDAWLLNLTNPMSCLTRAVCRETTIKTVGLCHEVSNFCMDLAIALGKPHTAVRPVVAGVNHFPVICELDIEGKDGLAVVRELVSELGGLDAVIPDPGRPDRPHPEPFTPLDFATRHALKLSLLDRYGALPAAGDRHLAEFVPSVLTEHSGWGAAWGIELTSIERRQEHQDGYLDEVAKVLAGETPVPTWDSGEMVAPVVDAIVAGTTQELPLNIPNAGQCPDLPDHAVVESMCIVDGAGIRGRDQARVPAPLAELLRRHVAVHELTIGAALSGDRAQAQAAFSLDPLAGRGDLRDTDAMVDEMLAGTARWLPQFAR
jgi:alpha-galactosidase/6-phospho-beta-glucosidase family protein